MTTNPNSSRTQHGRRRDGWMRFKDGTETKALVTIRCSRHNRDIGWVYDNDDPALGPIGAIIVALGEALPGSMTHFRNRFNGTEFADERRPATPVAGRLKPIEMHCARCRTDLSVEPGQIITALANKVNTIRA